MEVVFVDWSPINSKSGIRFGGQIRRYYAWISLNKMVNNVIPFRKENGSINWKAVIKMFNKDSKIWGEYSCGGVAHLFVLLASFIRFKKTIILDVHDFGVEQHRDTYDEEHPFLKKLRIEIVERLLISRANVVILPSPGTLDYFRRKNLDYFRREKSQKVIIMVPGVGEDEVFIPSLLNEGKEKKIKTVVYFGSIRRKEIIPLIIELFSELEGWELLLVGQTYGVTIEERENVRYRGVVSHDKLQAILDGADVILIPDPKKDYPEKGIAIKIGYALKYCKPVIATKLKGISDYVSMIGLKENVIYVEEWNLDSLKDALQKASSLNINAEKTIERLRAMAWEPRFRKAIELALDINHINHDEIEWI